MLLSEHRNSKFQGNVGVGSAIAYFAERGYGISIPLTDCLPYDIVIDIGGKLKKVQVKTTAARSKYGIFVVDLRTNGGQSRLTKKLFDKSSVDFLFVLTENGTRYLVPSDSIGGIGGISLGEKYRQFILSGD